MTNKIMLIMWVLLAAVHSYAAQIPVENFAQLPDVDKMRLSPVGDKTAQVVRINTADKKGSAIQVHNLKTDEKKFVLFSDDIKYSLNWLKWKDNKTLLVGIIYPHIKTVNYGVSLSHDYLSRESRMYVINTETGEAKNPFSQRFLGQYKTLPVSMDDVVDVLADDPEHFLIAVDTKDYMNQRDTYAVFKVNVLDGKAIIIQKPMMNVREWWVDQQHQIRLALVFEDDGTRRIMWRETPETEWKELCNYKPFSEDEVTPLGFGSKPNELYVRAYHKKRFAIFKINLADKSLARELVFADADNDVYGRLVYSPVTNEVIGLSSSKGGMVFFDTAMKSLYSALNKFLPNTKNYILGMSKTLNEYLVYSYSDTDSGTYLIWQRKEKVIQAVGFSYGALEPTLMSKVNPYNYKARDGLDIKGFLTLPIGRDAKNLATIIFPHGGPISFDTDSFDYWTQFFASKGYAVLQMNYRGSSGQGLDFRNAGLKNWGLAMQDDIEDGAKKLIADGIADAKRICIVGASYGGYAALEGAVKTPDLYRCAISIAGISDVEKLLGDRYPFWKRYSVIEEIIGKDPKHLAKISPINNVDKIKIPILLIHGEIDRQVDVKQSSDMYKALVKAGKNAAYVELANEDHYLTNEKNRILTFKAMDEFLNKHLPTN